MLIIVQIILSTLFIFSIKCDLQFIDPVHEQFSSTNFDITKMLSSSSPYPEPRVTPVKDSKNCKPSGMWLSSRHGSKFPGEEILNDIKNNLVPNIQKNLKDLYGNKDNTIFQAFSSDDEIKIINDIMQWENILAEAGHKNLNENGIIAMQNLGNRLKDKYNTLLTNTLQEHEIYARTATEDRCIKSGKLFLKTFYQGNLDNIIKKSDSEDKRIKLAKVNKDSYLINLEESGTKMRAELLFFEKHCVKITERIRDFLFPEKIKRCKQMRHLVNPSIVKSMYNACVHGQNNLDKNSAWCKLFSFEDLQIFEAMYDLQYWHQCGYYLEANKDVGTPIIKDMLNFIEDPKGLKLKLFIGHTSNCLSIITRLNLFRDEGLSINNILEKPDRKWKTSNIAPFGCNSIVIVYKCGNQTEYIEVSIFLNEVPLMIRLGNGNICTQCPKSDVVNLIKSLIS